MAIFESTSRNLLIDGVRYPVQLNVHNGNTNPQRLTGFSWTLIENVQVQWQIRIWGANDDPDVDPPRIARTFSEASGQFQLGTVQDVLVYDEELEEWGWNPNWQIDYRTRGRLRGEA